MMGFKPPGSFETRCQFHQRFTCSFYACRSQKRQMTLLTWLSFFAHSGSTCIKAVCRMLMKLSPTSCSCVFCFEPKFWKIIKSLPNRNQLRRGEVAWRRWCNGAWWRGATGCYLPRPHRWARPPRPWHPTGTSRSPGDLWSWQCEVESHHPGNRQVLLCLEKNVYPNVYYYKNI